MAPGIRGFVGVNTGVLYESKGDAGTATVLLGDGLGTYRGASSVPVCVNSRRQRNKQNVF